MKTGHANLIRNDGTVYYFVIKKSPFILKLGDSCTTQGFIGTRTLGMPGWHNPTMRDEHLRRWVTSTSISSSVTPDIHAEMTSTVQSTGCCSLNSCLLGSCCDRPQQDPCLTGWPQQDPYLMGGLGSHHPWSISCCLWGSVPPQLSYKEVCLFLLSSVYEVKTCFVLFFCFYPWPLSLPRPLLTGSLAFFQDPLFPLLFGDFFFFTVNSSSNQNNQD